MKKAILIGVPLILLLVLVGWRYMQKSETVKQLATRSSNQKNGPANVVLGVAGARPVDKSYEAVGTVESPFTVELSPKLVDKISELPDYIREGYHVKKGQLLGKLDPTEIIGQVLQAKSQLAQAEATFASAKFTQHPTNENVTSQIEQGKATVQSNLADYNQVKENLEAQVHQAHSAVLDARAKVDAAKAATNNAEASVESAKASLADAQAKLNRENTLYKQGYVAAQDVDDSIAAQKVAKANVDVAQGLLKSAKQNEVSVEQQEKEAVDNEAIVKKTGETNIQAAWAKVVLAKAALKYSLSTENLKPAYVAQLKADQAAIDAALGNLNQANSRLKDCDLVSSIDGTVSKRNADVGTVVTPGSSILEIQFLDWLYVTSAIPVEYTGQIVKGTRVRMNFDAIPGLTLNGTVTELSNVADPQSRQYQAQIRIDNSLGKFSPGMYARCHFLISTTTYPIVVPREAVKTANAGTSTVTVVDSKNVAHIVTVTTGEQDTNYTVITDGVKAGDKVVVLAYTTVREGQKVVEGGGKGKKGKGSTGADATSPAPSSENSTPTGDTPAPTHRHKGAAASQGSQTVSGS